MVKDREAWRATVHGVAKSQTWLSHWTTTTIIGLAIRFIRIFVPLTKNLNKLFGQPSTSAKLDLDTVHNCVIKGFCCLFKVKWKLKSLSCIRLIASIAYQAPLSVEFSRQEYWSDYPFSRGSSWPRNRTRVSCMAGVFFTSWATRGPLLKSKISEAGKAEGKWEKQERVDLFFERLVLV